MPFCWKSMCALAMTGAMLSGATALVAQDLVVKTELGKVQGKTINDGKVKAYLGIPYAAPPVGDLRWKAPQPAAKWEGVKDATKFGPHCAQGHVFDDMVFQDSGDSEDCLSVNVYAPATATAKSKLPVLFWIHGGGFSGGGSNEPRHNGDFLPLKNVVLVTINYRLGVFGFAATAEMAAEAKGVAGNYGLADQIAALEWVKANIAGFGGDAGNVTIFGESAGSFAVSTLMASPAARGLFHKAIGESGGAFSSTLAYEPLADREKADQAWIESLGVKTLAEARALPTEKILAGVKSKKTGFPPVIDGKVLIEPVADTYAAGKQAHVPLIAGWNSDEGSFFAMRPVTLDQYKGMMGMFFKERAEEALKLYPATDDKQAARALVDFGGDQFIAFSTYKWLNAHRKTGQSPVYRYHFELAAAPSKFHPGSWAFHSDDIEYVFGTLDTRPGATIRPEDRVLSEQMMSYWTNFARTGDPNGKGLPTWPKYGAKDELIHLDQTITSGPDALKPRYDFLEKGLPAMHF